MPTHTLAAIVDQVSFLPQQGEHAMEELGPLTTAEGYVPKVACLCSLLANKIFSLFTFLFYFFVCVIHKEQRDSIP